MIKIGVEMNTITIARDVKFTGKVNVEAMKVEKDNDINMD